MMPAASLAEHPAGAAPTPQGAAVLAPSIRRILIAACLGLAVAGTSQAQTVVRVGSTPTGVPFTFLDTKTNQISGIMVDLMKAIGKDQGFTIEITPMTFSTLIAALQANKIDVIAAAMYITPTRQEVVDFSDPIYHLRRGPVRRRQGHQGLQVDGGPEGRDRRRADRHRLRQAATDSGLFKEIKVYDTIPDIIRDVNLGRIKAGFADYPIVAYQLLQGGYPDTRLAKNYKPVLPGSVGIAVQKGDKAMLDKINASLRKMKADGTIDKILAQWGLK